MILSSCLSIGQETDISATVQPIGVEFCAMVELCPGRVFSRVGGNILGVSDNNNNNNNNNIIIIIINYDNVYGAVIMAEPLREFTRFI